MSSNLSAQVDIVLATLNARYIHSAFGLRYLQANLGELQRRSIIHEFTLESRCEDIAEILLAHNPRIIALGVYIWNIAQTEQLVRLLKALSPHTRIVLGGPEVSHETEQQAIIELADYTITGWGEISFALLAESLLADNPPQQKIIVGEQAKLDLLKMPYTLYSEDDIKNRVLYVEASRGCPFKCEFCLSALDKTAWPFDLDRFLVEMNRLYLRGARHFKFVDRTFNLKIKSSLRILQFFLERMDDQLFLHFEVIPDHLPPALQHMIAKFPAGSLQFEIGIQTFNTDVQSRISRRQNNQQAKENITWIVQQSKAHVHADLIFGLPGESMESFADSFNQLYALHPHEIQVGILKRLKGSPIIRHAETYNMVYNPNSPYNILSSSTVSYPQVQQINRFARYWDLIGNSGRFKHCLSILLADQPFQNFSLLSDGLFRRTRQTHKISLLRLYDLVFDVATDDLQLSRQTLRGELQRDFEHSGLKSTPQCLRPLLATKGPGKATGKHRNARQARH